MVSQSEPRPTLVLNPPDDDAFRESAEHLIETGIVEPDELQDCLREQWPRVLVRPRELAGEQAQIWYVYRDGHWVRTSGDRPDPSHVLPGGTR
jgi:hypothetical protein